MIVPDASLIVELLTNGPLASSIGMHIGNRNEVLIVPHLVDIEVMNALRGLVAGRRSDPHRVHQMLSELRAFPAERYPHEPLLNRIWDLRHNFTAYDATYIALAEHTNSALYTCDAKLRTGHRARVVLFTNQ